MHDAAAPHAFDVGCCSHAPLTQKPVLPHPVLAGQLRTALMMDSRDMAVDAAPLRARFPTLTPTALDTVIRRQLARTEPEPVLEAA